MSQEDYIQDEEEFITQDDVQEQYELDEADVQDVGQEMDEDDEEGQGEVESTELQFEDDSIQGFFEHRGNSQIIRTGVLCFCPSFRALLGGNRRM
jgi:hypothetical protein